MKHFFLTLILIMTILFLQAQEQKTEPGPKKFHVGLAYAYTQADLTLTSMTHESRIGDMELDPFTLSREEIDDLNSFMTWNEKTQSLCVVFGMFLLNKPDHKWQVDANVFFGLSKLHYQVLDTRNDTVSLTSTSSIQKPTMGLEFLVKYSFDKHWGMVLEPYFIYSWGELTSIDDKLNTKLDYFTETREHDFHYIYSRINVMANYTYKRFSFSAGPGVYFLYLNNKYTLTRTNPSTGSVTEDMTRSKLRSKFPMDGVVDVTWKIIDPLTFRVQCALGTDFLVQPGLFFNF
jgi:hypothetical protein